MEVSDGSCLRYVYLRSPLPHLPWPFAVSAKQLGIEMFLRWLLYVDDIRCSRSHKASVKAPIGLGTPVLIMHQFSAEHLSAKQAIVDWAACHIVLEELPSLDGGCFGAPETSG